MVQFYSFTVVLFWRLTVPQFDFLIVQQFDIFSNKTVKMLVKSKILI